MSTPIVRLRFISQFNVTMAMNPIRKRITIICGHYGVGKTNLCLNLALQCASEGRKVTLIDLDTANVYFRSTDHSEMLSSKGIRVIGPIYANTNVDIPALPASIGSAIDEDACVIIDVGGDDVGAMTLSRYTNDIARHDYDMFCVINRYRSQTTTPEEAVQIYHEIESTCRLKATGIINNSHLKQSTNEDTIIEALGFADSVSDLLGIPVVMTTAPRPIADSLNNKIKVHPIDVYVGAPWEVEELGDA